MADTSQLFVLISILNGLALARLFERLCQYFYARERVVMEWLVPGWAALTFLFIARSWWSLARTPFEELSYWRYLGMLSPALIVYLLAVLLTPDLRPEGRLDLVSHYRKVSGWVFGLLLALFLQGQVERIVTAREPLAGAPNLIRLIFIAFLLVALSTRRRWVHVAVFATSTALYFAFAVLVT